ncbi:MAG: hypothetical protein HYW01_04475 [Deltaproteobacteria bacterium]|nr:hypothetical protein [Deltaproteobacteria bacterium]
MKRLLTLATALIATFIFLFFTVGVPGNASEEEEIHSLIETATTPEDHMKIAEFYEKQAAKMELKASSHASMADSYKNRGKPLPGLAKHCGNLSKKYKGAAEEYKAMAIEHREMAKEK